MSNSKKIKYITRGLTWKMIYKIFLIFFDYLIRENNCEKKKNLKI